jgi:hypothetical protein
MRYLTTRCSAVQIKKILPANRDILQCKQPIEFGLVAQRQQRKESQLAAVQILNN